MSSKAIVCVTLYTPNYPPKTTIAHHCKRIFVILTFTYVCHQHIEYGIIYPLRLYDSNN